MGVCGHLSQAVMEPSWAAGSVSSQARQLAFGGVAFRPLLPGADHMCNDHRCWGWGSRAGREVGGTEAPRGYPYGEPLSSAATEGS